MHTLTLRYTDFDIAGEYQTSAMVHHNSDWSGIAYIVLSGTGERIAIPGRMLQALVEHRLGSAIEHVSTALSVLTGGR